MCAVWMLLPTNPTNPKWHPKVHTLCHIWKHILGCVIAVHSLIDVSDWQKMDCLWWQEICVHYKAIDVLHGMWKLNCIIVLMLHGRDVHEQGKFWWPQKQWSASVAPLCGHLHVGLLVLACSMGNLFWADPTVLLPFLEASNWNVQTLVSCVELSVSVTATLDVNTCGCAEHQTKHSSAWEEVQITEWNRFMWPWCRALALFSVTIYLKDHQYQQRLPSDTLPIQLFCRARCDGQGFSGE